MKSGEGSISWIIASALICVLAVQRPTLAAGNQLHVVAATWGGRARAIDVTDLVAGKVRDGNLEFDADCRLLGDPIPGIVKQLALTYELNGVRAVAWYVEGEHVLIRPPHDEPLNAAELAKLHDWTKQTNDPNVRPTAFGAQIRGDATLRTARELPIPVRIEVIARTDDSNIRIYFGTKGVVIFNWESKPDELRYHHPDSGVVLPIGGHGQVSRMAWHHIIWDITASGSEVQVDGQVRARVVGHYIGLSGTAGIGTHGSTVGVRQFEFSPLAVKAEGRAAVGTLDTIDLNQLLARATDSNANPNLRANAIAALSRRSDDAAEIVPTLAKLLVSQTQPIPLRIAVADALPAFGQDAVTPLKQCTGAPDELVRREVMRSLVRIPPGGTDAVAAALADPQPGVRRAAFQAIAEAGLPSAPWLARIRELVKSASPGIRRDAYYWMPRFAKGDSKLDLVEQLVHAMSDPDEGVRRAGEEAFDSLDARSASQLAVKLPELLNNRNPLVRLAVVKYAGRLQTSQFTATLVRTAEGDVDPAVRSAATQALLTQSPAEYSKIRIAGFVKDLTDRRVDDDRRQLAINELAGLSPVPDGVLTGLIECLKSRSPDVRRSAANVLGHMGLAARQAGPALVTLTHDSDPTVRAAAETAASLLNVAPLPTTLPGATLQGIDAAHLAGGSGISVPTLISMLHASDLATRRGAAEALGKLGASASAAFGPLAALARDDPGARKTAVKALQSIEESVAVQTGPRAYVLIDSVPKAMDAFKSRSPDDRRAAMQYVVYNSGQAGTLLGFLVTGLADRDSRIRVLAADGLQRVGPGASDAVAALIPLLDDWSPPVRERAGNALDAIACDDPRVVDAMNAHLRSSFPDVRGLAAWSLEHAGAAARAALPLLRNLAEGDPDPNVRRNAAAAVQAIQKATNPGAPGVAFSDVRAILIQQLRDPSPTKRTQAAEMLAKGAARNRSAIADLSRAMARESDPEARITEAWAIAGIDADPSVGLAILEKAVTGDEPHIAAPASQLLARLGGKAVPAIPYLHRGRINGSEGMSVFASEALQKIDDAVAADPRFAAAEQELIGRLIAALKGPPGGRAEAARELSFWTWRASHAAPALAAAMKDPDPVVRRNSARTIGFIHAQAGDVKVQLTASLNDPDRRARIEAAWALGKVQKQAPEAVALLIAEAQDASDPAEEVIAVQRLGELGYKSQTARLVLAKLPAALTNDELSRAATTACALIDRSIQDHQHHAYPQFKIHGLPPDESGEERWFYD